MRHRTAHLTRRLVLAQTLVDDLTQQIVVGPGQIFHLGDDLGTHPMHPAEHQRRAETGRARWWHVERHLADRYLKRGDAPSTYASAAGSSVIHAAHSTHATWRHSG